MFPQEYKAINIVKFSFSIISLFFLTNCSKPSTENADGAIVLYFENKNLSPSDELKFIYGPQTFDFNTDMSNNQFSIIHGGRLTIDYMSGSLASSSGGKEGGKPHLDYYVKRINGNKIAVPQNYETASIFTVYYHYNNLVNSLSVTSGITADDFKERMGKFKVLFQPLLISKQNNSSISLIEKMNAAYLPSIHNFMVFKPSALEKIPISYNPSVLSHEFGHSLWNFFFVGGKTTYSEKNDEIIETSYAMRGLNEGTADVYSGVYTGNVDPLYSSLGNLKELKEKRNFSKSILTFDSFIRDGKDVCKSSFYCIGTIYANALFKAQMALGLNYKDINERGLFMKSVFKAMTYVRNDMTKSGLLPILLTNTISCDIDSSNGVDKECLNNNGKILNAYFNSLVSRLDSKYQYSVCAALSENFGDAGFASAKFLDVCKK